ncbi:Regulatory LuxR family protein [Arthrobacter sp. 9V]|uniref:helix-turn-helix transcriptional regulator n=1 Tax=Arthrobacter sp. 9V TaxID=2653132 RepID=UPI0012EF8976|nr:response regulator transcription factor [Arthrobacter sp. 9V]VXB47973.1 Regulatory LuxR family protein [Arthrobacter sp. 9V]
MRAYPALETPFAATPVTLERAEQITRLLRDLVRCDAVLLSASNPAGERSQHQKLTSDGYSEDAVSQLLENFIPETRNPGFGVVRNRVRQALRWADLDRDWDVHFAFTPLAEEYLRPAGFNEGISASLWLPGGHHVGAIHMNWLGERSATEEARRIVEQFLPVLAAACDPSQPYRLLAEELHGDANVAVIAAGFDQTIAGRELGKTLQSDGPLWPLLLPLARHGDSSYIWLDGQGTCHRISITRCVQNTALVAEREVLPPYGLTPRELQIATLLADGVSNPEIADELVVSRRTVSTHVEHILAKLGVSSRAEAAALVTREGLRLIHSS